MTKILVMTYVLPEDYNDVDNYTIEALANKGFFMMDSDAKDYGISNDVMYHAQVMVIESENGG